MYWDIDMSDEELRRLLASAKWRLTYTYMDGREEFTGSSDTDGPTLEDIRRLVNLVCKPLDK